MTITAVIAEYNPFHNGHALSAGKSQGTDRGGLSCRDYERRFRPARRTCHSRSARPCGAGASWRRGPYLTASVSLLHSAVHSISHAGRYRFLLRLAVSIFSALAVNMETRRRFWNSLMFCSTSRRNTVSCSPVCFGTDFPSRRRAHRHFPLIFLTALPSLRFQKKNLIPF